LVVQASVGGERSGSAPRNDWWLLGPGGEPRNLTAALAEPPAAVTRGPDGDLLAVAGGDLWRIDPGAEPANLTASFAPTVRSIARREGPPWKRDLPELVIDAGEEGATSPYRVSLAEGPIRIDAVSSPSPHATIDAHWPSQRAVLFRAVEEEGVFAWATDLSSGRTTRLVAINEHLADVAPARQRLVEYRGADGDPLNALVLLPHDYQEGKRYPVLTWVYAGDVFRKIRNRPSFADKFSESSLNLLPLLARGTVVLLPSIPLPPEGKSADPMIELPKGVIPAVDRLIELGIADPDRLAVGGHSYGGYSAYVMIATTNRFKAAIVSAGTSDLVSQYGTLDARFRYGETATEGDSERRWSEGGQGRMGVPPYENLWRYLRNSPIHFVDRVQTPVLIIQGDMDFVPLAQGEEFFLGLHRQGKSARFLRYFGEGHTVESPANVRHMWGEIFAWLDTHLGPPDRPALPK
ncbi:MAG TPA: prolyl oligopeptidase family serine peptidase, partial [Planctomycetota bacterium]|nr:prolyl oligopeptidase family serine peptidase [Planctomycetota bacterium]